MRIPAFVIFALSAMIGAATAAPDDGWEVRGGSAYEAGIGAVAGMSGSQAIYLKGAGHGRRQPYYLGTSYLVGSLERQLPLKAWQGKRLRLSLRLKNEGMVSTNVALTLVTSDGAAVVTRLPGWNRSGANTVWSTDNGGAWRSQEFVLDVPADADEMIVGVGMKDKGMVWVDGLKLEAVGTDVPVSRSYAVYSRGAHTRALIDPAMNGNEGFGAY